MNALKVALFTLALFLSGSVLARPPVPMTDVVKQAITTTSGNALPIEQIQQVIRTAAEGRKWVVSQLPEGVMQASLSWNANKHTIVVTIASTTDRYTITYKDSINMRYGMEDGKPVIHPHYNKFVAELCDAIRVELMKF